jgi:hypothetical protein
MTQKTAKDWTSPDGRWQWNGPQWSPPGPRRPSLQARVVALPPIRRSLMGSALIAALMLLTLTVACGSPASSTQAVATASTAIPTAEPTATPTPAPTATPTQPPTAARTPASAAAVAAQPHEFRRKPRHHHQLHGLLRRTLTPQLPLQALALSVRIGVGASASTGAAPARTMGASIGGLETSGRQGPASTKPPPWPPTAKCSGTLQPRRILRGRLGNIFCAAVGALR